MVKIVDKQNVFNKGIMTSKLRARDDLQQYTQGVAEAKNFVLSKYGPLTKRVGTKFIADLGDVGKEAALIPFVFSVDKSILLEFTSDKIRFYTFDGENFGQSRIYKLVADGLEETAEHKYLYITDDPIKSWASQDDKTKATKVFADKSCSELIGYINAYTDINPTIESRIGIAGAVSDSYYDEAWIDNSNGLLYFICFPITLKEEGDTIGGYILGSELIINVNETVTLPEKIIHSAYVSNSNKLTLIGESGSVYNINMPNGKLEERLEVSKITPNIQINVNNIRSVLSVYYGETTPFILLLSSSGASYITFDSGKTWYKKSFIIPNGSEYCIKQSDRLLFVRRSGYVESIAIKDIGTKTDPSSFSRGTWSLFNSSDRFEILYMANINNSPRVENAGAGWVNFVVYDQIEDITYMGKYSLLMPIGIESYLNNISHTKQKIQGRIELDDLFFFSKTIRTSDDLYTRFNEDSNTLQLIYNEDIIYDNISSSDLCLESHAYVIFKNQSLGIFNYLGSNTSGYTTTIKYPTGLYISKSTEAPNSTDKELLANTYTKSDEIVYYEKGLDEEINNENLRMLSYAQSLDVLYLAFPDGKTLPKELRRRSDVDWELVDFQSEDGPYNEINYDTSKTLKLSSHEDEEVTVTSNFDLFSESDIGRHIRLNMAAYNKDTLAYEDHWTWGEITSFTNATTVKANMKVDNSKVKDNETTINSNTTTWEWRLGAWTKETGYPTKVTIHEQRLAWAGITDRPWVWLSNSFAHRFYAPSEYDGTITDSNAITHDLSTDKISRVQWMKSVKNLIIGTEFEELRMMSSGPALAPSDVAVLREASYGSYSAEPVITEDVIIFIQRLQRSLRALSYDYYRDAFLGPNLALLSEDLTLGGIKKIAYQKEPYSVLWLLKEDGKLLTCTYDKEQEVVGWTECELAGDARVVDLIVFPSGNIKQDSVAFIVERTINGKTRRYLELLTREYLSNVELKDITFMDSSIRYQGTPTNKIAGLDHLEGETVTVVENGAIVGSYPVKNDVVTDDAGEVIATEYYIDLDTEVSDAWIGLPYDAYFKTLERDFGDKQLSTHNSKIRIYKLYFTLLNTLGLTVQQLNDGEEFNLIVFDPHKDISTQPEPISGREELDVMSTWTNDIMHYSMKVNAIPCLPCTVAGITTGIEINAL